mmetsp:Transcript_18617/g.27602  ORF Transcript_18617/g.27602 Transcript_18617/m.27602 type:complete len:286 (+) Transcript_18617:84-941(+)|eukprot:CAMPEP_0194235100 /NCGR_PEP_ID=MMETSP0158-20130606/2676_1 /TAXON_ID=33649 /ORGANISM="Thalassionema nitzschioides, Strain L26-B" /LENGTH=285 /DNA_ID=CAMNT_0038968467 /DNA_START=29 /DNA_END=886 /DNA_ORIENTATION=-
MMFFPTLLLASLTPFVNSYGVLSSVAVRTPITQANFEKYRNEKGADFDVVAYGGWLKLEQEANMVMGQDKLNEMDLTNIDVNKAGGWTSLQRVATDPKGALVGIIVDYLKRNKSNTGITATINLLPAILELLSSQGKGFDSDLVDGEWASVLNQSSGKSPVFQKAVAKKERAGLSFSNFDVPNSKFYGNVKLGRRSEVRSTVRYNPTGKGFGKKGNSIVLRRIMCDIVAASIKIWRFPRIPLPFLRRKGGYLDFVYLDNDIRITKGNRGGLFVHFRPEFLEKMMG